MVRRIVVALAEDDESNPRRRAPGVEPHLAPGGAVERIDLATGARVRLGGTDRPISTG